MAATRKTGKATAKKAAAKKRSAKKATLKTQPTMASVSKFIESVENDKRREDAWAVLAMMSEITGEPATMWGPSIVGFGQYHYKYESGREGDFMLVGFSPRKANLVLYVMGSIADDDPLRATLGKYKTGVGCLYVNKLEDVHLPTLKKLIAKSYKATKKRWS